MGKRKTLKKISFTSEDYIKANKALARLEELERNGGRWIAINRPHKNKKAYDRKRDKKVDTSYPFNFNSHHVYCFNTNSQINKNHHNKSQDHQEY